MDATTPTSIVHRRRRSRFCRRLGAIGITATLGLGVVGPLTDHGAVDAAISVPRRRVATIVNARRVEHGLRRLRLVPAVHLAAQKHSRDQARMHLMTHVGSDGADCGERLRREGYRWSAWGENVAMGYPSARAVVRAWMHSAGHRANILNPRFRHFGVGLRRAADGTTFWTLDFARPG
jgi:uncharacterized protein YkwD